MHKSQLSFSTKPRFHNLYKRDSRFFAHAKDAVGLQIVEHEQEGEGAAVIKKKTGVLRIRCIKDTPRFDMPLLLGTLSNLSRTAFACNYNGNKYLVTTANAVSYCTKVEVFVPGISEPYLAQVQHISMEHELAVLRVTGLRKKDEKAAVSQPKARRGIMKTRNVQPTAQSSSSMLSMTMHTEREDSEASRSARLIDCEAGSEDISKDGEVIISDEDTIFWESIEPLVISTEMPRLLQKVSVLHPETTSNDDCSDDVHKQRPAAEVHLSSNANSHELVIADEGDNHFGGSPTYRSDISAADIMMPAGVVIESSQDITCSESLTRGDDGSGETTAASGTDQNIHFSSKSSSLLTQSDNAHRSSGGQRLKSTAVVSNIEVIPHPSTMQSHLGLVLSVKLSNTAIGAPVIMSHDVDHRDNSKVVDGKACGQLVGVIISRFSKKIRGKAVIGAAGSSSGRDQGGHQGSGGLGGQPLPPAAQQGMSRTSNGRAALMQAKEDYALALNIVFLHRFLEAVEAVECSSLSATGVITPSYFSLPSLGIRYKPLPSAAVRKALGMQEEQQGVLILAVNPVSSTAETLKPGDVLTHVDGQLVGNDGKISFRPGIEHRIPLTAYVSMMEAGHYNSQGAGDQKLLSLQVLRGWQVLELFARLDSAPRLIPTYILPLQPLPAVSTLSSAAVPISPLPASTELDDERAAAVAAAQELQKVVPATTCAKIITSRVAAAAAAKDSIQNNDASDAATVATADANAADTGLLSSGIHNSSRSRSSIVMTASSSGRKPQYLIVGGLILTCCSVLYLRDAFGMQWTKASPVKLLEKMAMFPSFPGEEIVIIAEALPLSSLSGYDSASIQHNRITKMNGDSIKNLRHLAYSLSSLLKSAPVMKNKVVLAATTAATRQAVRQETSSPMFLKLETETGYVIALNMDEVRADTKLVSLVSSSSMSSSFW
ncbi:hypothetical protein CEUSTIGMA_g129.t1 [Chlamydomonas eustigma]|uniref:Protease Do-like PDZ domain-containing protein n=1 Tax=Chlamydomonas eustigma TaxID=1157962 RepID=A0A250WPC5_9CHLO|nr:hypothetical protein CEUSTIGMA_g129.t1 [Chlamydomonas eustigma]|eukprot:GAX72673.1 hypothetical protein CEUSTIGMA_g129.t1 [Chlamydomonas eustigma]